MCRAWKRVGSDEGISSGFPRLNCVESGAPVSAESHERFVSTDGHGAAVFRALWAVQESYRSHIIYWKKIIMSWRCARRRY